MNGIGLIYMCYLICKRRVRHSLRLPSPGTGFLFLASCFLASHHLDPTYPILNPILSHITNMGLPDACKTVEPFFYLDDDKLKAIVARFRKEMEEGLAEYGKPMAMIPTFVTGVPDGTEEG